MPLPSTVVRRGLTVLAMAAAALVLISGNANAADPGPPPSSIAAMGDSITRGFNACGWYTDCTRRSFSTGDSGTANPHYLRILAKNPAISGHNYNVAKSGAKAADMPGQAAAAVATGAAYVTVLIGANDACTSSEGSMTTVAAYRASLDAALATLQSGLPNAKVYLISIPDIKRLWAVGKVNGTARTMWSLFSICQSMLANPTSTAQADEDRRDRVRQRVADFNGQLAAACAAYGPNCAFDNNAIFNYPFALNQVSGWDYFHPNVDGQAVLSSVSYAAGFNW